MFGVAETPYDLRFRFLDIPVRVHPFFWVLMAMLGWYPQNIAAVLIFVGCAFVSVLAHEYGHGLTARMFGSPPSIVLGGLGGLCIYHADRQTPQQRLVVLLCGPGAGLLLCLVTMAVFSIGFHLTPAEHLSFVQRQLWMEPDHEAFGSLLHKLGISPDPLAVDLPLRIYWSMVEINILWSLLNLLPIWPLDGGRVFETILSHFNPRNGRRWTHVISLVSAGLIAFLIYNLSQSFFNTLLFIYIGVINYQMLDSIHRAQSLGVYDDDWWRR